MPKTLRESSVPVALYDLQENYQNLRDLHKLILQLSTNKAAAECLLENAFWKISLIEENIKELGGNGYCSLDDTLEFVYAMEKKFEINHFEFEF